MPRQLGQVSSNFAAAKNGQVSSKFAAAKNGQVSSKFAAAKNGQVSIIYGCAYSQIKIRKIGENKFSILTAGSIFRSISRVMGVINEFGHR